MNPYGEIIVYQTDDATVRLDVCLQNETVWITQAKMAELLAKGSVQETLTVRQEESRTVGWEADHYNLDAIISAFFRVTPCYP